jgi:hypothetical protein
MFGQPQGLRGSALSLDPDHFLLSLQSLAPSTNHDDGFLSDRAPSWWWIRHSPTQVAVDLARVGTVNAFGAPTLRNWA